MNPILQVKDLTKFYGDFKATEGISFELLKNTSTALIGPNGSGKTTTLSMLTGLVEPSKGAIKFYNHTSPDIRSIIGFLPQYPKFFPWLSAFEFVEMAAMLSGVETKNASIEAKKTLGFVGLDGDLKKKVGTFSGGMKQRLGLAQAIVHKPQLLLLDEPVSALDPVGRRQILNLLKELQQKTTILYSTHILNDAEEMTDQLLFLKEGRLVEQGSLSDVRNRYAEPKVIIEFDGIEEVRRFLRTSPWNTSVDGLIVSIDVRLNEVEMSSILMKLSNEKFQVRKVERQTVSLEEIFMRVAVIK
ncbi:ATP-binding cassette domain-containing protein [Sporosarcina siberiensis]|uniref:ATP-binding cassette domain-containing protein n=1 Tax=Sporosarcina siberiensis TaxID=1365606 RepID=A0ABW4SF36_9BACL